MASSATTAGTTASVRGTAGSVVRRTGTLVVLAALLVPPVLVLNAVRLLTQDRYVRYEYRHAQLGDDGAGLPASVRLDLALAGLHAIQPDRRAGIEPLRRARLGDGRQAFTRRELRHMQDVRTLLGRLFLVHVVAAAALAVLLAAVGARRSSRASLPRLLRAGALATLGVVAIAGLWVLVGFDTFLLGFHRLFFAGESWHFSDTSTLIRVYPERFWSDTARVVVAAVLAQAAALYGLGRLARHVTERRGS